MPKGKSIKIRKNISWKKIANKTVILNRENENHYVLNSIGVTIWKHIVSGKSLSEVIDQLSEEYSVARDRIAVDLDSFLKNLEKENIISVE